MPIPDNNHTNIDGDDIELSLTLQPLQPAPKKPRPSKTSAAAPKPEIKPLLRLDGVSMGPVACLEAIFKCTNVVYISGDAPAGSYSTRSRKLKS